MVPTAESLLVQRNAHSHHTLQPTCLGTLIALKLTIVFSPPFWLIRRAPRLETPFALEDDFACHKMAPSEPHRLSQGNVLLRCLRTKETIVIEKSEDSVEEVVDLAEEFLVREYR